MERLDPYYRPTRAEISLDALRRNLEAFRAALPQGMRLMASVKANAYGHGAVEVAREAERFGVDYLGVAFLDEAIQLRKAGIATPILVLGFVPVEGLELARKLNITIALFREDILHAISALPAAEQKLRVHVKVDTGMGRLGLPPGDEAIAFIERALAEPKLEVEGLFTHYARADEANKDYTALQYERFNSLTQTLAQRGIDIPIIHAANSAAGMETPQWAYGMTRLGIGMYGLYPSQEVNQTRIKLSPVMSLKTQVVMVKQAPPGWGISYGTRYFTAGEERIGTLPIGYADGYSRMMTGKAQAIVRGVKVPVLGTICMDQCMIALDPAAQAGVPVEAGEEVVLIGEQGSEAITADDLASMLDTINYEVTCMIAARVPRVYIRDGQPVDTWNPLG
ncbi:alanine racemase [Paenibacillus phyllosphaerae]|uniref:Alanine racemase n=1 Tax=Paenibacillus phyllosphaerae TaxID=274593 RepID=A0A7W5B0D7_9BACL|nr:alanine racemase [Paenibacillus phyllosphaerae]